MTKCAECVFCDRTGDRRFQRYVIDPDDPRRQIIRVFHKYGICRLHPPQHPAMRVYVDASDSCASGMSPAQLEEARAAKHAGEAVADLLTAVVDRAERKHGAGGAA